METLNKKVLYSVPNPTTIGLMIACNRWLPSSCAGISVNDEILSQSNPLFVVNSNTGTPPQMNVPVGDTRIQRVQRESVNVVEAAHVVKHSGIL